MKAHCKMHSESSPTFTNRSPFSCFLHLKVQLDDACRVSAPVKSREVSEPMLPTDQRPAHLGKVQSLAVRIGRDAASRSLARVEIKCVDERLRQKT